MQTIDVSWQSIVVFLLILLVPVSLNRMIGVKVTRDVVISMSRMAIQLLMVGVYLNYLFILDSLAVNTLWLLVMVVIGSSAIVSKAKLPYKPLFTMVTLSILVCLLPALALLLSIAIQPIPLYSSQYMIPLAGMIIGNSMTCLILALQTFFTLFSERHAEYQAAISLGATPEYATRSFVSQSIEKALAPSLASISATGLVTLPGMMTGQILGGTDPLVAVKYQFLIMVAIFSVSNLSIAACLKLICHYGFSTSGALKFSLSSYR